jgi:Ca-activated chloride channel family protein
VQIHPNNPHDASTNPNHGFSIAVGPADGISLGVVDAPSNSVLQGQGDRGGTSASSSGGGDVGFSARSIYGDGKPNNADDNVVYNRPAADSAQPLSDSLDEGANSQSKPAEHEFSAGDSGLRGRGERRSGALGRGATRESEVTAGKSRHAPDANQRAGDRSPAWREDDVGYFPRNESGGTAKDYDSGQGRDRFARLHDNRFLRATDQPLSTFSIDVDTASYSVVRSRIENRTLPPPDAVRVEELVNYFSYDYPQPTDAAPFAVHVDVAACPWATKHRLVRIGLKGKEIAKSERPASNLVFLVDVSGSMQPQNKLPLVQSGLLRLVGELDERDRVAIVVYAGSSGCVLASTPCTQANKERIRSAIDGLQSGGSTNGAAGIELAYQIAQDHRVRGGANRVILGTDGDFNVGTTDDESLKRLVAERAKSGVFLTALGFGMGNHNDRMLETIADNGNGAYGYIDDEREVEKLFVRELSGTLITIAKDVKIQVEFNPALVGAYRLIGYENRILAKEDFNNDKKDAGDIGAGHTVTALYEIVPAELFAEAQNANAAAGDGQAAGVTGDGVDQLEFQRPKQELELTEAAKTSGDLLLVKLRYKAPDGDVSTLIRTPAKDAGATFAAAANDFKFAASVAGFGMILRGSPFRGDATLAAVEEIASANVGEDPDGQRREFVNLVRQARQLTGEGLRD